MNRLQIFLDMDGVVADFAGGIRTAFPEWEDALNRWDISEDMWNTLHAKYPKFWGSLDRYPDCNELINGLDALGLDDFIMLSALPNPKYGTVGNVVRGKTFWIMNNIGVQPSIFCMRSHKKTYANEDSLLIDDSPNNVKEFQEAGGLAILHKSASKTLEELKSIVDSRGRQKS